MPGPTKPRRGAQNPTSQNPADHPSWSFPLPREVAEQAQRLSTCLNAGLWLDHFTKWETQSQERKRVSPASAKREKVCQALKNKNLEFQELIDAYRSRWNKMLEAHGERGYVVKRFVLRADSRVVVGLGAESVLETSIRLHRVYGFPIIPGSALKGLARAYAKLVENKNEKDPLFADIFGKGPPDSQAGKVIFFDAIPENSENLNIELDVMNPHYAPYYHGKEPPADYHNPVPIFFLTIGPGSEFLFAVAARDKNLAGYAVKYLKKGLIELGIGAKTTAGYGRWERPKLRLITFLGTGKYKKVEYVWSDGEGNSPKSFETEFFSEAVLHLLGADNISQVLVLVTPQAKEEGNFKELENRLGEKFKAVDIPYGQEESELWQMFDKIVSEVRENDEIVLDITHGFRSIPMIIFSVADYLKKIKSVTIRHILYGAYEAGTDSGGGIRKAPIFDLTPLLDIIEWAGGLETFLKKGEATLIGQKIEEKHNSLYRNRSDSSSLPGKLRSVGKKLQSLSLSLHLARPHEVLKDAYDLLGLLRGAKSELEKWVKPFATIIDQILKELEPFAYKESKKLTRENLEKQLALIEYYFQKGLIIQAILLAREWMVSYVILTKDNKKDESWLSLETRAEAEKQLNVPNEQERDGPLIKCWERLGNLRNDVAHCGMRDNPSKPATISSNLKKILDELRGLFGSESSHTKPGHTDS